ncbi:class I SAM-dependent methyltransferase [Acidobacteriota bacterium]
MNRYHPLFTKYYDHIAHGCGEALATKEDISFVREAFESKCNGNVKSILDIGCGTGRYLIPLTLEGFRVTGVDDCPDMLSQCKARLGARDLQTNLVELDLMELPSIENYDAVLCMNSVICYFLDTSDIIRALSTFLNVLRPGGLLLLEIWNIFANTSSFGKTSTRNIEDGRLQIMCKEHCWYESFRSIYHCKLDVEINDGKDNHTFTHEEILRAMTAGEMIAYLKEVGFIDIASFARLDTLEPESGDEELVFLAVCPPSHQVC